MDHLLANGSEVVMLTLLLVFIQKASIWNKEKSLAANSEALFYLLCIRDLSSFS